MRVTGLGLSRRQHLDEGQLLPAHPRCLFCGGADRAPVCGVQESPRIEFLKCARCAAATVSRIPTPQTLDAYYRDYYSRTLDPGAARHVTFDDVPRFARRLVAQLAGRVAGPELRVLDFGGGDGSVAARTGEFLLERGFRTVDVDVVDYNESVTPAGDRRISVRHCAALGQTANREYDFVLASAVVEHLPEPAELLSGLLARLRPGGVFYARTPYAIPLIRLGRRFGADIESPFPAHLHDLGQDFWESWVGKVLPPGQFELLVSRPSLVDSTFGHRFLRTLAAYAMKAPWYLLGRRYTLVGGWEIFLRRLPAAVGR
jgi:SAM-dependent methyltransferase